MNEGVAIIQEEKNIENTEKGYDYRAGLATSTTTSSSSHTQTSPESPENHDVPTSEKFDAAANNRPVKKSKKNKKGKEVAVEEEQDPFAHLPDHEKEILRRQLSVPEVAVSYKTLFRYATKYDVLIMLVGAIGSIVGG